MNIIRYVTFLCLVLLVQACEREFIKGPNEHDTSAPDPIRDAQVENLPGGAKITYSLPHNDNLLYVKAEYSIRSGVVREMKASYHKNFLYVEGFPGTDEYEVRLYVVNRAEVASEPVVVKINPKTPPVLEAFASLELKETFGGVSVSLENSSAADLRVYVLATDSLGQLEEKEVFYTKMKTPLVAARGFNTEERRFGVYVKDRFDNRSDTVFATLKPLFERELDKNKFKPITIGGDYTDPNNSGRSTVNKLWDGLLGSNVENMFATLPPSGGRGGIPQSFSFDLGVEAQLSRFIYYPRANGSFIYSNQPRKFELWGSNNPSADGNWNSWTKLMDCEMIKPSGSPQGVVTDEDRAFAVAGVPFDFPLGIPRVRYIRFKTTEVWSGNNIAILELTFFGSDEQ